MNQMQSLSHDVTRIWRGRTLLETYNYTCMSVYLLNTHAYIHVSDFDTVTEPNVSATRFPARAESEESGEDGMVGNTSEIGSPYIHIGCLK